MAETGKPESMQQSNQIQAGIMAKFMIHSYYQGAHKMHSFGLHGFI